MTHRWIPLIVAVAVLSGCGSAGNLYGARVMGPGGYDALRAKKQDTSTSPFAGLTLQMKGQAKGKSKGTSWQGGNAKYEVTITVDDKAIDLLTINGKAVVKDDALVLSGSKETMGWLEDGAQEILAEDDLPVTGEEASRASDESKRAAIVKSLTRLHDALVKARVKAEEREPRMAMTAVLKKFLRAQAPKQTKAPGKIGVSGWS